MDEDRVFAAGFSNGASMTFNLTCSMYAQRIALCLYRLPSAACALTLPQPAPARYDTFAAFSFTGATMPTSLYPSNCGLELADVKPVFGICGGNDGCGATIDDWFKGYGAEAKCTDDAVTTKASETTTCKRHHSCGASGKNQLA